MWNTPSLPLLSGPLRPGVVALVRLPSMTQIEMVKLYVYKIGILEPMQKKKIMRNKKDVNMNMIPGTWMCPGCNGFRRRK